MKNTNMQPPLWTILKPNLQTILKKILKKFRENEKYEHATAFQYFGAMKIDQCRDEEAGRVRDNFGMVSRRVVFGIILINQYN